ncbi:MAG: hypothetical protein ACREGR_02145 [Minisyncoccia bacterium]
MQLYEVFFHDEFRQIKCGLRRVVVEVGEDKVTIQLRKGAQKVHTSRERFFALEPRKITKES